MPSGSSWSRGASLEDDDDARPAHRLESGRHAQTVSIPALEDRVHLAAAQARGERLDLPLQRGLLLLERLLDLGARSVPLTISIRLVFRPPRRSVPRALIALVAASRPAHADGDRRSEAPSPRPATPTARPHQSSRHQLRPARLLAGSRSRSHFTSAPASGPALRR